jgi:CubicO group peptidase (beta-lactamase class C family)
LQLYAPIELFSLEKDAYASAFISLKSHLTNYDYVIISLHNTTMNGAKNFGMSEQEEKFITEEIEKHKTIFVDFGNAYTLSKFSNLDKAKAVILAYEDMPVTQSLAAQLLFGGFSSEGRIPIQASETFAKNSGLDAGKHTRLKYTFPEDAGMNTSALSRIDTLIGKAIGEKVMPGCQVLVAKDSKVVYCKSFGTHSYEDSSAVQNSDLYDIASVTKITGTALAVMDLYDKGQIDLDKPLSKYLPRLKKTNKKNLIIRDVLAHQAGLQSWIPFWKETVTDGNINYTIYQKTSSAKYSIRVADSLYMRNDYRDSIMKWIDLSPLGERGKYVYSDLGPILMKALVEQITKMPIDEYLNKNFYKPLGLTHLVYHPRDKFPLKEIIPTELDREFRKQLIHGDVHDPAAAMLGGVSGNAGLFANANDVAVIMQMLLNKGSYGGRRYLSEETVSIFTSQQFPQNKNRRGLFFDKPEPDTSKTSPTCKSVSLKTFGHQGFTGTCAWADPEYNLVYIFLSNRVNPDATNEKIVKMNLRTEIQQMIYDGMK